MALQFRRGAEADLPSPTDASIGEPLFTTDSGKLFVKKADGTYAEISGSGSTNIDLSGIDAGSMVKVNPSQDGFVAAAGGDVPSHTHTAEAILSGTLPSAVAYPTTEGTGFSNAVEARLLVELPTAGGVLDIAQESTLTGFIDDFPVDADGALDIAQESTLQLFSTQVSDLQSDVNALDYLSTYFTDAALPPAPTTTGFLKYDSDTTAWSLVTSTATAPTEINGGNATSFGA